MRTAERPVPARTRPRLLDDRLGRAALGVVAVVTVFSVVRCFGPMTYLGDIWRQSDTASIARNLAGNGMQLFSPQINWGGAGPGYVETEFQLLTWLTAALYLVFGEHVAIGRLVSLAFMLAGTAAFWALVARLLAPAAARWSLVAFVASPLFMRYGSAFMPDATALAFTLLALLATALWLEQDRTRWLVAAAAAVASAGLVKPTSLVVVLVILGWLSVVARPRLRRPAVYVAGLAALVAPGLWLLRGHRIYVEYGNTFGVLSGGDDKFDSAAQWATPAFWIGNATIEALWTLGVVGVPLAAWGAVVVWRRRAVQPVGTGLILAGLVAVAVLYLAVARYSQNAPQYHLPSLPFAAMLVGTGLAACADRWAGRGRAVMIIIIAALLATSATVFVGSMRDTSGAYSECATALGQVSVPADLVVVATTSASVEDGVANNWQEPVIFFLADRRGWSLASDQQDPSFLAADRALGARFMVSPDPSLVAAGSGRATWLAANATPVRTFAADGCGVWALAPAP